MRNATNLPNIEWEKGELVEVHDHDKCYKSTGHGEDGSIWGGTWYECDGEFIEILDIEKQ
jgi:hypothetical protein